MTDELTTLNRTVNILGAKFQVVEAMPDIENAAGISNDCKRLIKIDPSYPAAVQIETFYHEVVHMILKLSGVTHCLKEGQDEAVAQAVGYGLFRLVSDNEGLPVEDKE